MNVTISVTEDHIRNGRGRDPFGCPIALAIAPYFPHYRAGVVGTNIVAWDERDLSVLCVSLPEKAVQFQRDVDHGITVVPITFEISLPEGKGETMTNLPYLP